MSESFTREHVFFTKGSLLLFCLRFPNCCAWFLETRHDEVIPQWAVEVMGVMAQQISAFNRASFPSVQQKGGWTPNLGHFFQGFPCTKGANQSVFRMNTYLATSSGSWILNFSTKSVSQVLLGPCENHDFESDYEVKKIMLPVGGSRG